MPARRRAAPKPALPASPARSARRRRRLLVADAKNRALRTFLQGVAIDVLVAVAVLAYSLATSPNPVVWALVPGSLARSVVQAGASYVMRRFVDPSRIPSPLPPAAPGPASRPEDPAPEPGDEPGDEPDAEEPDGGPPDGPQD